MNRAAKEWGTAETLTFRIQFGNQNRPKVDNVDYAGLSNQQKAKVDALLKGMELPGCT